MERKKRTFGKILSGETSSIKPFAAKSEKRILATRLAPMPHRCDLSKTINPGFNHYEHRLDIAEGYAFPFDSPHS